MVKWTTAVTLSVDLGYLSLQIDLLGGCVSSQSLRSSRGRVSGSLDSSTYDEEVRSRSIAHLTGGLIENRNTRMTGNSTVLSCPVSK